MDQKHGYNVSMKGFTNLQQMWDDSSYARTVHPKHGGYKDDDIPTTIPNSKFTPGFVYVCFVRDMTGFGSNRLCTQRPTVGDV